MVDQIPQIFMEDDIEDKRKLIVVLEEAPLLTAKIKKQVVLLNSDDHKNYINSKLKQKRPDILHQCLLTLQDSPLNKRGLLKIYIKTANNVIIDVNPRTRIPRTYKRFAAMIAQVLTKLRVRAIESSETLLRVIRNPITDHLPPESFKVGTSSIGRMVSTKEYFRDNISNKPIVVVVGAVSKGNPGMEALYIDDCICISKFPLSAGQCLSKISNAFEAIWQVV